MSETLIPLRETPVRDPSLHEGPYYGAELRQLLTGKPLSSIDRFAIGFRASWPLLAIFFLLCGAPWVMTAPVPVRLVYGLAAVAIGVEALERV